MEITVESLEAKDPNRYEYEAYTVRIGTARILTVESYSEAIASKWVKDAVKSVNNTKLPKTLVVGLAADRYTNDYTKRGLSDDPYDLIQLCIGSHCLLYHLPDLCSPSKCTRFLGHFFSSSKVVAVGMNMEAVKRKMARDFDIEIARGHDLNQMAVEALEREDLDLGRYDLDRLAKAVLGKSMDVVRPEKPVEWFDTVMWYWNLEIEKVKYATVDAYLCYLIGEKLLWEIEAPRYFPEIADKKKKEKEKENGKGKQKNKNKNSNNNKNKKQKNKNKNSNNNKNKKDWEILREVKGRSCSFGGFVFEF